MGNCFDKKPSLNEDPHSKHLKFNDITKPPSVSANLNMLDNQKRAQQPKFAAYNNNRAPSSANGQLRLDTNGNLTQTNVTSNNVDLFRYQSQSQSSSSNTESTNLTNTSNATLQDANLNKFNKNAYIALFDYHPRTDQDLGFKKGEILYVDEQDKKKESWWKARKRSAESGSETILRGYIPANYVAELNSIESQSWYFANTKRMEAEKLLMLEHNTHGSFLIRISDGNQHAYSLSVRDNDSVKHYRIRRSEDDGSYFITKRVQFNNLSDLVLHYSKKPDGLWVQLSKPCVKIDTPVTDGLTHTYVKDFEVDRNLFKLERKIGQGQFGDVWQGLYIMNNMKVAIKTLKEGMNPSDFKAEAALMRNLSHPKLIQLYALCTTQEPIYIITELMSNGSLLDYLQTPIGKKLSVEILVDMASQIADGMAYLETKSYIHRDLAARNVLVADNNIVKVADFGLARVVKDLNIYAARDGTKFPIKWTAPEAAIWNKFSIKSDVWSFGIVLTEIITYGRTPYPSMSNQEVLQQISRSYRMPQPSNCPDKLYQIMLNCWKGQADDRPTFETLRWSLENFFNEDEQRQYRYTGNSNSQQ